MMTTVLSRRYAGGAGGANCAADINSDRAVDGADLGAMLAAWGDHPLLGNRADLDSNRRVDGADIGLLLARWGACN
jgi:hypothetical protein